MPQIPAPYQAMAALAAAAAPRAELWRTICGLLLAAFLALVIIFAAMVPVTIMLGPEQTQDWIAGLMNSNTASGVIGLMFSFLPQLVGLMLAVLILMRRGPFSLLGPAGPFLRNFVRVGLPLMGLWLLLMPITLLDSHVSQHLTLAQQAPWLPAALLGLLVQTLTEEVVFRGYLQQQLAARFKARWVWLGVPSVLFGLAHYSPEYPPLITWLTILWAGCFGLAAADLTARTGNLGAGLALHFTNNISAILLVGMAGNLGGLTLFHVTLPPGDIATTCLYLAMDGVSLLVGWLVARVMLRV